MPPHGGITVAEEGNKRRGSMKPAEARQCAKDIVDFFKAHDPKADFEPTETQLLEGFCKSTLSLPIALEELYNCARRGVWFEDKELLPLEKAAKMLKDLFRSGDNLLGDNLFPFAEDESGDNLLVVHVQTERVYEWDCAENSKEDLAECFTDFMESYRDKLLAGKYEYLGDGMGVCEKSGAGQPRSGK
ncbi:hypothetical protein M885DRAFT_610658 [Pelagophyceae sp. CCMP2097]|nr:hypothetical protein M885DRAFT_610658 [Pelagophyceae sp. CCMP2097]|mmetsp:Transcript_18394/g.61994  ORF Transcript_18394/g.61994 Transcript_18394/m.61994 type:complete len:188 (-) Transcript_18394:27-590(-)